MIFFFCLPEKKCVAIRLSTICFFCFSLFVIEIEVTDSRKKALLDACKEHLSIFSLFLFNFKILRMSKNVKDLAR